MRVIIASGLPLLVIGLFFAFAYFHSRSSDRARVMISANDLLVAHEQIRQFGSLTNWRGVSVYTNRVTIGETVFEGELAADSEYLTNHGSLVVTKDATLIWIDKKTGPAVMRSTDGRLVMPRRFRDF